MTGRAFTALDGVRRFEDRVAVVTGAGSGIGRATAVRLATEGAVVACLDVDADSVRETAQLIGSAAHAYTCDVSARIMIGESPGFTLR